MTMKSTLKTLVAGLALGVSLTLLTGYAGTVLPIARGGTGSATKNFLDLTTAQSAAGLKTLTGGLKLDAAGATVNKIWTATGSADSGAIGAASYIKTDVPVSGVTTADRVVSWDTDMGPVTQFYPVNAYVSGTNTVTVVVVNLNNGGTNNPDSCNYNFVFLRF